MVHLRLKYVRSGMCRCSERDVSLLSGGRLLFAAGYFQYLDASAVVRPFSVREGGLCNSRPGFQPPVKSDSVIPDRGFVPMLIQSRVTRN